MGAMMPGMHMSRPGSSYSAWGQQPQQQQQPWGQQQVRFCRYRFFPTGDLGSQPQPQPWGQQQVRFCRYRFFPTGDLGYRGVRGAED